MRKTRSIKFKSYWKVARKRYPSPPKPKLESGVFKSGVSIFNPIERRINSSFIGDINSVLEGVAMTNSNIMILEDHNIVLRKDHLMLDNVVKLVTGGKIGHEPLFLSYIGAGMLTAGIVGSDISSPSSKDIYLCLKELSHYHNAGILAIVPNCFEEVVNFGLAIEKARCNNILVDMVTIGDDCWESGKQRFGRRCLAGITLAFKIAGAMAEDKKSMKDIYLTLRKLCMGTISCHLTKAAYIGTDLENGTGTFIPTDNICELIYKMLTYLIDPKKYFALNVDSSCTFILMVNSYTCERLFLYNIVKEVLEQLSYKEINIIRVYAGNFVSGERGFSITLLNTHKSIRMLRYADTACSCQFWPRVDARGIPLIVKGPSLRSGTQPLFPIGPFVPMKELIDVPLLFACKALLASEHVLNKLDVHHNFGTSLVPALQTILKRSHEKQFPRMFPYNLMNVIGYICQDHIANIHGTLLYIFFIGAAQGFLSYSKEVPVTIKMWVEALLRGVDSVKAHTMITENDLTILTALAPFACALKFFYEKKIEDVELVLDDSLVLTSKILKETYPQETPIKKKGLPEVTSQAVFIALTGIVEGVRYVLHQRKVFEESSEGSSDFSKDAELRMKQ